MFDKKESSEKLEVTKGIDNHWRYYPQTQNLE